METITFLLGVYFLAYLICDASIFARPRDFVLLFTAQKAPRLNSFLVGLLACYYCTGFWVSLLTSIVLMVFGGGLSALDFVFYTLAGAGFTGALHAISEQMR